MRIWALAIPVLALAGFMGGCGAEDDGATSVDSAKPGGGTKPVCGNGVIEGRETCDTGTPLPTCAEATAGARPVGEVTCTRCKISTRGCTEQAGGAGG